MSREILKVENLSMRFGGLLAVNGVALTVKEKQVVALIGPNGAGKTTVFNCLTGFYKPSGGSILLDGEPIEGLPGHKIALKGVVRTFQNVRLFKDMTAVENLLIAQHRHLNTNFLAGLFKTPGFRKSEREAMEFAEYWLEKVNLKGFANRPAGTLAYGQQRRLEIARCMMTRPRILMLDEPAAGLNPKETEDLKALISVLREEHNVTVLLIAQHRHLKTNFLSGLFKTPSFRKSEREAMEYAEYWLDKVNLREFANRPAGTLAYGQQRRLEIARCMMTRPRILMLDEPAAGLNPKETEDLKALISMLREEHNVTVLLIEHDMKLVMSISDHIVVINQGTPLANGTPEQIRDNPEVIKAYLGEA